MAEQTPEQRVFSALTDLGFHAAELRTLAGRLAEACARNDLDESCDLAQALLPYVENFREMYVKVLSVPVPTRDENCLHLVRDYSGMQERTSV